MLYIGISTIVDDGFINDFYQMLKIIKKVREGPQRLNMKCLTSERECREHLRIKMFVRNKL